jgi:photosystem II stability/assembly factor-like uncharacterized protein
MSARRVLTSAALLLSAGLVVAGCASGAASNQPIGRPQQIVMTSPSDGYAVWPSGVRSIVIGTTDGWRTVTNRTPLAVPTDGGMVLGATSQSVVTGVLPFHLLTISPVLTSSDLGKTWAGSQLPGALNDNPHALARVGETTYAVLAKTGEVVEQHDGASAWAHLTSPTELDPAGGFTPQGISSPDGQTLFVIGESSPKAAARAFVSRDRGGTWTGLAVGSIGIEQTTDAPCVAASGWLFPVRSQSGVQVARLTSAFLQTSIAPAVVPASNPALACGGGLVWIAVTEGDNTRVVTVGSTGKPHYLGQVSGRITALAPTSATQAFAATSDVAKIGTLTTQPSLQLTTTPLPSWVATVGGAAMRN